ncbi:S-adenosyl-L-methionine-dependent methyltransferase [Thozetella sp. PMI_491]|nr:S-adenosyl-L-methionine-dependent methyltransferase [Thozetella sp. PMI_491]
MDTTHATHEASETFAEKNAKHFDKFATPGDWPEWVRKLQQQIVDVLVAPDFPIWLGLSSEGTTGRRMLDYAGGDGLISKTLKPHFASVIGVDVSTSMLDKYKATIAQLGAGPDEMMAVRGDLLADVVQATEPPLPEEKLRDFDLIVVSMALHHFENPGLALQRLATRLAVGGTLLIIDFTPIDGSTPSQVRYEEEQRALSQESKDAAQHSFSSHEASHTVSKPGGFSKQEMHDLFGGAGCGDFRWKLAEELCTMPMANVKTQLFFARASKS